MLHLILCLFIWRSSCLSELTPNQLISKLNCTVISYCELCSTCCKLLQTLILFVFFTLKCSKFYNKHLHNSFIIFPFFPFTWLVAKWVKASLHSRLQLVSCCHATQVKSTKLLVSLIILGPWWACIESLLIVIK